jgi:hypothetical protein
MIKVYCILALLAMLTSMSSAADWLEGGSVGRGDYSEVRQYFTDPIFYSSGTHATSSDPAIRQMEESMDRYSSRYATLGSLAAKSKTVKATSGSFGAVSNQQLNAAGGWHMELSDGKFIDLDLHQSGSRVFGVGSVTSSTLTQWAVASGDVTGSSLILDIVPANGMELYTISLDISRLHLPGSYTVFRANAAQSSGNVKANRN